MTTHEENGVIILDEPQEVDHLQFSTEHIGCDSIVDDDVDIHPRHTRLYAYASTSDSNGELYKIFLSVFKAQGIQIRIRRGYE